MPPIDKPTSENNPDSFVITIGKQCSFSKSADHSDQQTKFNGFESY